MVNRVEGCRENKENEDRGEGGWRDSLTARSAVSVQWLGLKPDWWGSSRLFWEKKAESWLEAAHSMVLERNGRSDAGR